MQELLDLTQIVTNRRLQKVELMNENDPNLRSSKIYELFKGIKEGKLITNELAAKVVCGTDPSDKKYQMLKSRLRKRLLDTILFLDLKEPKQSPYVVAKYECDKNLFAAKTLIARAATQTSIKLLDNTLKLAEKYHLTYAIFEASMLLSDLALRAKTRYSIAKYIKISEDAHKTLKIEMTSNNYLVEMQNDFIKTTTNMPHLSEKIGIYIEELESVLEVHDSNSIRINYYLLCYLHAFAKQDYKLVIKYSNDAIAYFYSNIHLANSQTIAIFESQKLEAYIFLRDHKSGIDHIEKTNSLYVKGSDNWFLYNQYKFLLLTHAEKYNAAIDVLSEIVHNKNFLLLSPDIKEKWNVFAAYGSFLIKIGLVDTSQAISTKDLEKFNLNAFLGDVPIFSKDKLGLNISIIIIQILCLLIEDDLETVVLRENSIELYLSRYLKKKGSKRSFYFLKSIVIMIHKDFIYKETKKHAKKYSQKLNLEQDISIDMENIEVILYDKLWLIILDLLKAKK